MTILAVSEAETAWYQQWSSGERSKNEIERTELDDPKSHGKRITKMWRERLGRETEGKHQLVIENETLRALLEHHGIDLGTPVWCQWAARKVHGHIDVSLDRDGQHPTAVRCPCGTLVTPILLTARNGWFYPAHHRGEA